MELALFRTAQEALRNVERHADASTVRAELVGGQLCVEAAVDEGTRVTAVVLERPRA